MKALTLIVLGTVPLFPQLTGQPDRYPDAHALIREAEIAAMHLPVLKDHRQPSEWAGGLYARAGYLDDAARAFGKQTGPPYSLWRARVLYGDLAGAEKSLQAIVDPEKKASTIASLADLLWKMGTPEEARIRFEAARRIAPKIANPERRKRVLASIAQGVALLSEESPYRLSPTPKPQKSSHPEDSPIPMFPVTTEGFRERDRTQSPEPADGDYVRALFEKIMAQDRDGLLRTVQSAATPFQKTLAMASLEHISIQISKPETAEQFARQMPEADSDCLLAKAEALTSAGSAWLRADNGDRAHADFESAVSLVRKVTDLPFGKVSILVAIARAEFHGGMAATSGMTLKIAMEVSLDLPVRPDVWKNVKPGKNYRDDAYRKILPAAIRARNLGLARDVAELWKRTGHNATSNIVRAWIDADQSAEAISFARSISDPREKAEALLSAAQDLLDKAGAPNP